MFPNVWKHLLIIYCCLKFTFKKVERIKKIWKKNFEKKKKSCEISNLNKPRFLRDFYSHGTMNVPCTSKQESIRNWRTFCGRNTWSEESRGPIVKMERNPSSCSIGIWNYHLAPSKSKSRIFPGPYPSPLCKYWAY